MRLGGSGGFYETPEMSQIMQMARSAFSQMARCFFEGLKVMAVMPSEPSMPKRRKKLYSAAMHTWDVDLVLLIDAVNDNVMANWIDNSLIIAVENTPLDISFETIKEPLFC